MKMKRGNIQGYVFWRGLVATVDGNRRGQPSSGTVEVSRQRGREFIGLAYGK